MTTLDKSLIGQYGVFQVASQLCWMGFNAVPTSRNTKAIDLIAQNPRNDKAVGIQVKTMRQQHKRDCSKDLYAVVDAVPAEMDKIRCKISNPFVFVFIPKSEKPNPRYFVVPKKVTFKLCKELWDKYVKESKHGDSIENIGKRRQPLSVSIGQLECCENEWQNLGIGA